MKKVLARKLYKHIESEDDLVSMFNSYEPRIIGLAAGCSLYWAQLFVPAGLFVALLIGIYLSVQNIIFLNLAIFLSLVVLVQTFRYLRWEITEKAIVFYWFKCKKEILLNEIKHIGVKVDPSRFVLTISTESGKKIKIYSIELQHIAELYNSLILKVSPNTNPSSPDIA